MTRTWVQNLASDARRLAVYAKLEGFGPAGLSDSELAAAGDDGRYRLCITSPEWSAAEPPALWRELLDEMPGLLDEQVPYGGGVPSRGGVTLYVLDGDNLLTSTLRIDRPAATIVAQPSVNSSQTSFSVGSGAALSAGDVLYIGAEAMRCTDVTGSTVTVERGYLGTDAAEHRQSDRVYTSTPFLLGRRIELYIAPADAADSSEEQLLGEYVVDGVEWDQLLNVWQITGDSVLRYLDRVVPREVRQSTIHSVDGDQLRFSEPFDVLFDPALSKSTSGPDVYMWHDGEVFGAEVRSARAVVVTHRGLFGTKEKDFEPGESVRQVFAAGAVGDALPGSFQRATGPAPDDDPTSPTGWVRTAHWVDLLLTVLCSPVSYLDAGDNYDNSHDNYSGIWGYGMGLPASLIDFDSFERVRHRTRGYDFPNFILGAEEAMPASELVSKHFLEPMGAYLTIQGGKVALVLPRLPLLGEATATLGADDFLMSKTDRLTYEPRVRLKLGTEDHGGTVTYVIGPQEQEVTFSAADFAATYGLVEELYDRESGDVRIAVPGGDVSLSSVYQSRAAARLVRLHKPRMGLSGDVDIASAWSTPPGTFVSVTLPELPDLATGTRGWTAMLCEVRQRQHQVTEDDGAYSVVGLMAFGSVLKAARIAPAAYIVDASAYPAAIDVSANRYTSTDAPSDLPNNDADSFTIGDVLKLVNLDGTDAAPGETATVTDISNDTIELDSDFNGALADGLVLTYANYDDCTATQTGRYSFMCDRATQTVDAGTVSPYLFAEP